MDIYKKIVEHFGYKPQMGKAEEKLAELIVALKHYKDGKVMEQDVCSEIADVEIMCAQLRIMFNFERIDDYKTAKLLKLKNKING